MQNGNTIWAIIYVSSTMRDLSKQDVEYYLTANRKLRQEKDISGIVVLAQNNTLVLQEGPKAVVKSEFEEERKHPAHHSLIKLYDGPIPHRYFEGFPLAFKAAGRSAYNYLDSFNTHEHKEHFEELIEMDSTVPKLIRDFIKNNS